MNPLTRRALMGGGAALAGSLLLPEALHAAPKPSFQFVHITDAHIQPELRATEGVKKAFAAIRSLPQKTAFGLVGGDLVMDAALVPHSRADMVYELWRQEAADLGLRLHYSIGNHDLYGLNVAGKPATDDPDFGKALWKRRLGLDRSYSTFDHQGWRFACLDSTGITPDYTWEGSLDAAQITWLDDLLRSTPKSMPMVFLTHFPIFTAVTMYTENTTAPTPPGNIVKNGKTFKEMIQTHNVKAVFQGHTHIVEEIDYLGVKYITGGAICGDWWKGKRLGVHPEGFSVVTISGDDLTWKYIPYGWKARV
jgi:Icc protein